MREEWDKGDTNLLSQTDSNLYITYSSADIETDVPSAHQSGRLPVLDLHLFVASDQIQFGFFQKPVASPFLILQRSTLSPTTKRNSLFQEELRRHRNMSGCISRAERIQIFTDFANALRISGYDQKYRSEVIGGS